MKRHPLEKKSLSLKDFLDAVHQSPNYQAKQSGKDILVYKIGRCGNMHSRLFHRLTLKNGNIVPRNTALLTRGERKKISQDLPELRIGIHS